MMHIPFHLLEGRVFGSCNDELTLLVVMSYVKKGEDAFFFKRILDVFFTVSRP